MTGLATAVSVLLLISELRNGYERALRAEVDRMGMQLMLVPLGCPYDAAARVLKGKPLENAVPESALAAVRDDPAVAVAAPLLTLAAPRAAEGRTDTWVGLDQTALSLKPWWSAKQGAAWFTGQDSVILGSDAAELEMRSPGDSFYSPEAGMELKVAGILDRSGTSDDSLLFVPLSTAQRMFDQKGKLTAIAIRLHDPLQVREASKRLQQIPGAQVVTLAEMMGVFLNLVGSANALMNSIAIVALTVGLLSVFNTLLAAVTERTGELCVMRAVGASRMQVLGMIVGEAAVLGAAGSALGMLLALAASHGLEEFIKRFLPLATAGRLVSLNPELLLRSFGVGALAALLAGLYPAWRASQLHPALATKEE